MAADQWCLLFHFTPQESTCTAVHDTAAAFVIQWNTAHTVGTYVTYASRGLCGHLCLCVCLQLSSITEIVRRVSTDFSDARTKSWTKFGDYVRIVGLSWDHFGSRFWVVFPWQRQRALDTVLGQCGLWLGVVMHVWLWTLAVDGDRRSDTIHRQSSRNAPQKTPTNIRSSSIS